MPDEKELLKAAYERQLKGKAELKAQQKSESDSVARGMYQASIDRKLDELRDNPPERSFEIRIQSTIERLKRAIEATKTLSVDDKSQYQTFIEELGKVNKDEDVSHILNEFSQLMTTTTHNRKAAIKGLKYSGKSFDEHKFNALEGGIKDFLDTTNTAQKEDDMDVVVTAQEHLRQDRLESMTKLLIESIHLDGQKSNITKKHSPSTFTKKTRKTKKEPFAFFNSKGEGGHSKTKRLARAAANVFKRNRK